MNLDIFNEHASRGGSSIMGVGGGGGAVSADVNSLTVKFL